MAKRVKPWTTEQITKASYNQLSRAVSRGVVSMQQVQELYTRRRETLDRYARTIEKSPKYGYAAFGQQRPKYETWRSLDLTKTTSDKLKALVDINEQWRSKTHTLAQRKAQAQQAIKTLNARGLDYITPENYGLWVQFAKFIRTTKYSKHFYIDSDEAERAFKETIQSAGDTRPNLSMLTELFAKYAAARGVS